MDEYTTIRPIGLGQPLPLLCSLTIMGSSVTLTLTQQQAPHHLNLSPASHQAAAEPAAAARRVEPARLLPRQRL